MAAPHRLRPPGIDRLSQLPDLILHHILSTVPTLEVVRTCVLSKRWRNLWASVPHLLFSEEDFEFVDDDDDGDCNKLKEFDIRHFVDMTLLLRDLSHIQTFKIFMIESDDQVVDRWIRYAAIRQVQNLHLSSPELGNILLPVRVFSCHFLTTLRLDGYTCQEESTDSVRLAALTKLYLRFMVFKGNSLDKLIAGCPALHHLIMCCNEFHQLHISSHQLKTFKLEDEHLGGYSAAESVITISAPALTSLYLEKGLRDSLRVSLSLKDVSSLVTAHIDVCPIHENTFLINDMLCNVQHLYLGYRVLEHIFGQIASLKRLPKFPRLKKLEVSTALDGGPIQAITCLLQCTSNLEHLLIIDEVDPYKRTFSKKKWELRETQANFLRNLKLLEVKSHKPSPDACAFISFLISNADALERIVFPWRQHANFIDSLDELLA